MPGKLTSALGRYRLLSALKWTLPIFGVAIVCAMWGGFYFLLTVDLERTEQEAYLKSQGSTQAYEAHLQRLFEQVDQLTTFVGLHAAKLGTDPDLNLLVRQAFENQPALRSLYVTDEHGKVIAVAMNAMAPSSYGSAADRRYFQVPRDAKTPSLFIGEPLQGRVSKQWVIHLSRAREGTDGKFAGVVVVTIDPAQLTTFYNEAQFGKRGLVGVAGLDLIDRSRRSGDKAWFGDRSDQNQLAPEMEKSSDGTYLAGDRLDQTERYMAYRVIPEYQLVVYTGLARDEVLAPSWSRRDLLVRFFAVATLAVLAAFGAFSYLLHRLHRSRQQADEAAARFLAASNAQLDPLFILSAQRSDKGRIHGFRYEHVNLRAAQWLGKPLSEIKGQAAADTDLLPRELQLRLLRSYRRVVQTRSSLVDGFGLLSRTGEPIDVIQQVVPVGDGVAITMRDVTEVRQKEQEVLSSRAALAASEQRLRAIADNLPVLISYIDRNLKIGFANETYERWFGTPWRDLEGLFLSDVWPAEVFAERMPHVMKALGGETVEYLIHREAPSGSMVLQCTYVPDMDAGGQVVGIYMLSTDVTELKQTEAQLSELLHTDTLTGLGNRRSFNERLPQALAATRRTGKGVALLYLDVDRFKAINDSHGHATGDIVLKAVAHRLSRSVRANDVVTRLAGDEFVVILENLGAKREAEIVARKLVEHFISPVEAEGLVLNVTISVGIGYDDTGTVSPADLLAKADSALYQAKASGRNAFATAS